jgi:hypothetical protein
LAFSSSSLRSTDFFQKLYRTSANKNYIPQPALEAALSLLIGRAGEEYIVVNGPKGARKSSVVNRVIANQSFGVLSLSLQSSDTDIYTIIANDICEQNQVWKINSVGYLSDDISAGKDCIWNNTKMRKNIFDELGIRPIDLIRLVDKTCHDVLD